MKTMKQDNSIAERSGWLCWRRWLKIALCAFAIAAIAIGSGWNQSALAQEVQPIGAGRLQKALRAISVPSDWYNPPVFESEGGELDVTLTMAGDNPYEFKGLDLPGNEATLRTYTGECTGSGICDVDDVAAAVGPTLKVNAGDTLTVRLVNDLPPNDDTYCADKPDDKVHCFNTTNLHTHGLHISPKDNSDNVLLDIQPQTTFDFEFNIPANHYPGTFWYHPHKHGSTSLQVGSGMAGALIVKDRADSEFPDSIKNANDRTFVFEQIAFDADGEIKELPDGCNPGGVEDMALSLFFNFQGGGNNSCPDNDPNYGPPKYTAINGQQVPLINLQPGEVERWRFIDAGLFVTLDIVLVDSSGNRLDLSEIALDGITLKNVRRVNEVKMAPGYRADVMVQAPETPGLYYLYKDGRGSRKLFPFARPRGIVEETIEDEVLAVVLVLGEPCDEDSTCHSDLPIEGEALPAPSILPDIDEGEVTGYQTVEFTSGFTINGDKFDIDRVDYCLKEDDVEEWQLRSGDGVGSHPFHIHVNAFQVVDAGATDFQEGDWHDTVLVNEGDPFIMRTRYEDFDGQFVFHCHILTHEDQGMMSLVEINDTGDSCNPSD